MRAIILRLFHIIEFSFAYIWEVFRSNIEVAFDVMTPRHRMKPAMIEIEIGDLSDRELLALSNLITMTPGTLSIDVTENREKLLIHAMYAEDPEALSKEISEKFRRKIANVF
ncbi:MAG: Na+/H+ antiporter subunit E [Verrucomicrobiota bacterium]